MVNVFKLKRDAVVQLMKTSKKKARPGPADQSHGTKYVFFFLFSFVSLFITNIVVAFVDWENPTTEAARSRTQVNGCISASRFCITGCSASCFIT